MHQHSNASNPKGSSFISRHLVLLVVSVVTLIGLYLLSRSMTLASLGVAAVVAAHIIAIIGVLVSGGAVMRQMMLRVHGTAHTHEELDTEGVKITWAGFYDIFVRFLFLGRQRQYVQSILKLARIQANENVLDVGCGTGTLAIAAKQNVPASVQIHGLDASADMIERARQKADAAQVAVDFRPGLVEAIHFPDETFDLVMNSMMVHHLPGELKASAFREMYRVLKPGGRLLVVDFEPPTHPVSKALISLLVGQMTEIDNSIVPPLLREVGFTQVEMGPTGGRFSSYMSAIKPTKQDNTHRSIQVLS